MSNYASKADLKNATRNDTSKLAVKSDLVNLKAEVDNTDVDKLKTAPDDLSNLKSKVDKLDIRKLAPDLSKLSNVVKNDVVKRSEYNAKIENIEDKISDITNLAIKTTFNAKINEVKAKIPSITNLTTTTALTAVENKITNVSNLVKKTNYNTKINEVEKKITDHNHDKYITTPEFNNLTSENFAARLVQANLVTKTNFDDKLKNLKKRITSNKTKHLVVENEFEKLGSFDSIYFHGKSHFEDDGTQNYLVFQTTYRYFKRVSSNKDHILSWKSKGLSDESIKPPSTTNNILNPLLDYVDTKTRVEFKGSYLKKHKISFDHRKRVNIYIVYEINKNFEIDTYPTLENCLFGAVKLTKHPDIDQYKYFGYGIGFDIKRFFHVAMKLVETVLFLE